MNILNHEAVKGLPAPYSQEHVDDPTVSIRILHPLSDWLWYPLEYDAEQGLFYGFVRGFEGELGYWSTFDYESVEKRTGLSFEVDPTFTPMPLSEVKLLPNREMPDDGGMTIIVLV